jgi:hypothetical protein
MGAVVCVLDVRATLPAFLRLFPVVVGFTGEVIILKIAILLLRLVAVSLSLPLTGAAYDLMLFAKKANKTRENIFAKCFI